MQVLDWDNLFNFVQFLISFSIFVHFFNLSAIFKVLSRAMY